MSSVSRRRRRAEEEEEECRRSWRYLWRCEVSGISSDGGRNKQADSTCCIICMANTQKLVYLTHLFLMFKGINLPDD